LEKLVVLSVEKDHSQCESQITLSHFWNSHFTRGWPLQTPDKDTLVHNVLKYLEY